MHNTLDIDNHSIVEYCSFSECFVGHTWADMTRHCPNPSPRLYLRISDALIGHGSCGAKG
jgi:hypothetical protein